MSRPIYPPKLAAAVREARRRIADLEREKAGPLPSGNSAPAAEGPNLVDLADVAAYFNRTGLVPVRWKLDGKFHPEVLERPPFSFFGAVATTSEADCPPLWFPYARTLTEVLVKLRTSGSTTTTIKCYKNGSGTEFATISLTSGQTSNTSGTISEAFAVGDYMTAACTAAGTGAKGWALYPRT